MRAAEKLPGLIRNHLDALTDPAAQFDVRSRVNVLTSLEQDFETNTDDNVPRADRLDRYRRVLCNHIHREYEDRLATMAKKLAAAQYDGSATDYQLKRAWARSEAQLTILLQWGILCGDARAMRETIGALQRMATVLPSRPPSSDDSLPAAKVPEDEKLRRRAVEECMYGISEEPRLLRRLAGYIGNVALGPVDKNLGEQVRDIVRGMGAVLTKIGCQVSSDADDLTRGAKDSVRMAKFPGATFLIDTIQEVEAQSRCNPAQVALPDEDAVKLIYAEALSLDNFKTALTPVPASPYERQLLLQRQVQLFLLECYRQLLSDLDGSSRAEAIVGFIAKATSSSISHQASELLLDSEDAADQQGLLGLTAAQSKRKQLMRAAVEARFVLDDDQRPVSERAAALKLYCTVMERFSNDQGREEGDAEQGRALILEVVESGLRSEQPTFVQRALEYCFSSDDRSALTGKTVSDVIRAQVAHAIMADDPEGSTPSAALLILLSRISDPAIQECLRKILTDSPDIGAYFEIFEDAWRAHTIEIFRPSQSEDEIVTEQSIDAKKTLGFVDALAGTAKTAPDKVSPVPFATIADWFWSLTSDGTLKGNAGVALTVALGLAEIDDRFSPVQRKKWADLIETALGTTYVKQSAGRGRANMDFWDRHRPPNRDS